MPPYDWGMRTRSTYSSRGGSHATVRLGYENPVHLFQQRWLPCHRTTRYESQTCWRMSTNSNRETDLLEDSI
jgi:hypothetical protein